MNTKNGNYDLLSVFLDDFVSKSKFSGLSPEEKDNFKSNLLRNYFDRINSVIILNTPSDVKQEFITILERDNQQEVDSFIKKYIPNFDVLVANETTIYMADIMQTLEENN